MNNTKKANKKNNHTLKRVGKVTALVVALLVFVFALVLLLAPMKASDVFASLGMKNLSVTMAHTAAKDSNSFDDWWVVFERSLDAQDNKMVCISAETLQKHSDFKDNIADKKVTLNGNDCDGKQYLLYQQARCSLLESPHKMQEIWDWCKVKYDNQGWGSAITTQDYASNVITGFVDALIEDDNIELNDFFDEADKIYKRQGVFSNMSLSQRKDFVDCIKKLVETRQGEISQEIKDLWQNR